MKKLLMIIGIIVGVLFSCNVNASAIPEGAVIKTTYNPDVYIVKYKNGKQYKRLILNPEVFESYGHLEWENIQLVSRSVMDSYVTSDLVRIVGQSDIYRLIPNGDIGSKHYLVSTIGHDLSSVYIINSVDFGNYITGDAIFSFFCNGIYYSNCEDGQEIVCPSYGKAYCKEKKQQEDSVMKVERCKTKAQLSLDKFNNGLDVMWRNDAQEVFSLWENLISDVIIHHAECKLKPLPDNMVGAPYYLIQQWYDACDLYLIDKSNLEEEYKQIKIEVTNEFELAREQGKREYNRIYSECINTY